MYRVFSSLALVALLAASPLQAEVQLKNAWLRAVPPVSPSMAGYVTVVNTGDQAITLEGASAEIAGHTMLHATEEQSDGTMRMRHLHHLQVPAGGQVRLAPGGTHLMLMHLSRVPAEGESVPVCLSIAGMDRICSDFPVSRSAPSDG